MQQLNQGNLFGVLMKEMVSASATPELMKRFGGMSMAKVMI
jgi:hypothetical protein